MPLLSSNPLWETFATRTLFMTTYGGADFGECQSTMARIGDGGDLAAFDHELVGHDQRPRAAHLAQHIGHLLAGAAADGDQARRENGGDCHDGFSFDDLHLASAAWPCQGPARRPTMRPTANREGK